MRRSTAMTVPRDEELSWGLQCADAVLGCASAYREGGGGSRSSDYERRVTDQRFSYDRSPAGDVQRARRFFDRFRALDRQHRDVLALAYGLPASVLRQQVVDASNLERWQAVERVFGSLAGVALYLAPTAHEMPVRPGDLDKGGVWTSAAGRQLIAFCVSWRAPGPRAACETCITLSPRACATHAECPQQAGVRTALDAALEAWGHDRAASREPRERRVYQWQAPPVVLPARIMGIVP